MNSSSDHSQRRVKFEFISVNLELGFIDSYLWMKRTNREMDCLMIVTVLWSITGCLMRKKHGGSIVGADGASGAEFIVMAAAKEVRLASGGRADRRQQSGGGRSSPGGSKKTIGEEEIDPGGIQSRVPAQGDRREGLKDSGVIVGILKWSNSN